MSLSIGVGIGPTFLRRGVYVPTDADVLAYFTAAEAAGATYSNNTKRALDVRIQAAKANNYWNDLLRINPMLADGGNVLAGVARCLKSSVGTAGADVLNNYVASDWHVRMGLQGNDATTFINTGWSISHLTYPTGFCAMSYRGDTIVITRNICGARGASNEGNTGLFNSVAFNFGGNWASNGGAASTGNTAIAADYTVQRIATNDIRVYRNNVQIAVRTTTDTLSSPGTPFYVGARNVAGVAELNLAPGQRNAGYSLGAVLDATKRAAFQADLDTFNIAIGRNL